MRKTKCTLPLELLIFDMDGVLIDVSRSYRETIRKTVAVYFQRCLGFRIHRKDLVTLEDIALFKSIGGFNNDWDLTSGLLLYLLSLSSLPPLPQRKRISSIQEGVSYLQERASRFGFEGPLVLRNKRLPSFVRRVRFFGRGLKAVHRALGNSWDGWVYGSGDLGLENLVQRIFQEVYLGDRFPRHHHLHRFFYRERGHYLRERLLVPRHLLATLRRTLRLGIASGRPRLEAELALRRFRLLPFFDSVVTLDECKKEEARVLRESGRKVSRSKPHPYPLLRAIRQTGRRNPRSAYVGDVPDDMLAAKAAKREVDVLAVGFATPGAPKAATERLREAGADLVIQNPRDLLRFTVPPRNRPHCPAVVHRDPAGVLTKIL